MYKHVRNAGCDEAKRLRREGFEEERARARRKRRREESREIARNRSALGCVVQLGMAVGLQLEGMWDWPV